MNTPQNLTPQSFWADQMEQGYSLVQQILAFPVQESGEGFASLKDAVEEDGVEILFSTSKIAGSLDRVFYMRESLVKDVLAIGREMNRRGWVVRIEEAVRHLCADPCPPVLAHIEYSSLVSEPGQVAFDAPRRIALAPGGQTDHDDGELLVSRAVGVHPDIVGKPTVLGEPSGGLSAGKVGEGNGRTSRRMLLPQWVNSAMRWGIETNRDTTALRLLPLHPPQFPAAGAATAIPNG